MKNNILQLHNQSERTVEKIDCPFSMPMSRKERPPMTKPREKTREELQAEIEGGKKKIRQFENREKMLRQKIFKEERRTRSHRLIVRGAVFESIVPEAKGMTNEESATFLRLALTRQGFHFHQLRHTYTSNLLANGAAPKDVQELLGHSDVSTTMNVYAHSTRKAKRESARLLDKVAGND